MERVRRNTLTRAAAVRNIDRIIAALDEPLTIAQLAEYMHMHRRTVSRYISHLMKEEPRRIRVTGWIRQANGGPPAGIYKVGSWPDAPMPAPQSRHEAYLKIMANPARRAKKQAAGRKSWRRANGKKVTVASPFAALGL